MTRNLNFYIATSSAGRERLDPLGQVPVAAGSTPFGGWGPRV